jgi:serine/threonine-protein kinase
MNQKKVVIKRLLPHLIPDKSYNAMFIDEAKLTARLVHPKIAQTFELGKVGDALYIAMELIYGIDVLALLREFAVLRRRIEPKLAAWIAHETLDALDYAHNLAGEDGKPLGIVHRDISPQNVLVGFAGDTKIVDFGVAKSGSQTAEQTKSGQLKGKVPYMSPEQARGEDVDWRSDIFAAGVMLFELTTGKRPFKERPVDEAVSVWVEPTLWAEVQYASVTPNGTLREPVFLRLRPDLP